MPAFFYLLTCWTVLAPISKLTLEHTNQVIHDTINAMLLSPLGCFWVFFSLVGFIIFTDTHSPIYRVIAGTLHALAHLTAAFFLGWGAAYFAVNQMHLASASISQLLLSAALIFCGGWIVGSVIMGVYLFVSLNIFGRHSNEAFSSIQCEDWKNFLRFKIDMKGNLTIYPIGLRKVPRKWKPSKKAQCFTLCSDDSRATAPELIEPPIVVYNPHSAG